VIALVLGSAIASSACYVEQRQDGTWWACDTVQTASGPVTGCQQMVMPTIK
jgi:hypothetical protein